MASKKIKTKRKFIEGWVKRVLDHVIKKKLDHMIKKTKNKKFDHTKSNAPKKKAEAHIFIYN